MLHLRLLPILLLLGTFLSACREPEQPAAKRATSEIAAPSAVAAPEVMTPDGVRIRYEVAGQGEPTILFIHGWSCDRSYWKDQIKHFSPSHRVVAIDLGGHGESSTNRQDWTIAAFGQDVRAVVEKLQLKNVILVGHSLGGYVATEAAALMPERVTGVVAVDSYNVAQTAEQNEASTKLVQGLRSDFRNATRQLVQAFLFTPRSDPNLVARVAEDMSSAPPSVGASSMENLIAYGSNEGQGRGLARVKVPVHFLNAGVMPTDLPYWRKYRADVELTIMPGVGHFLMLENPAEFNRLLENILQGLGQSGGARARV